MEGVIDTAVIGAGAAGLFTALVAAEQGARVALVGRGWVEGRIGEQPGAAVIQEGRRAADERRGERWHGPERTPSGPFHDANTRAHPFG